jgi:hypothetical protein
MSKRQSRPPSAGAGGNVWRRVQQVKLEGWKQEQAMRMQEMDQQRERRSRAEAAKAKAGRQEDAAKRAAVAAWRERQREEAIQRIQLEEATAAKQRRAEAKLRRRATAPAISERLCPPANIIAARAGTAPSPGLWDNPAHNVMLPVHERLCGRVRPPAKRATAGLDGLQPPAAGRRPASAVASPLVAALVGQQRQLEAQAKEEREHVERELEAEAKEAREHVERERQREAVRQWRQQQQQAEAEKDRRRREEARKEADRWRLRAEAARRQV